MKKRIICAAVILTTLVCTGCAGFGRLILESISGILLSERRYWDGIQPDTYTMVFDTEPVAIYYLNRDGEIRAYELPFDPEKQLQIRIGRGGFYGEERRMLVYFSIFITQPYEKLNIKEISFNYNGENHLLLEDYSYTTYYSRKTILYEEDMPEDVENWEPVTSGTGEVLFYKQIQPIQMDERNMIINESGEPFTMNGEKVYKESALGSRSRSLDDKIPYVIKQTLRSRKGEEKEIELIQIYSFDDGPLREERVRYKVVCGG
jgi:hypothetical protein